MILAYHKVGTWSLDQTALWIPGTNATTGEHVDLSSLALVGAQLKLVQAVKAAGKPTVVVFVSGKPVAEPWIQASMSSFVWKRVFKLTWKPRCWRYSSTILSWGARRYEKYLNMNFIGPGSWYPTWRACAGWSHLWSSKSLRHVPVIWFVLQKVLLSSRKTANFFPSWRRYPACILQLSEG